MGCMLLVFKILVNPHQVPPPSFSHHFTRHVTATITLSNRFESKMKYHLLVLGYLAIGLQCTRVKARLSDFGSVIAPDQSDAASDNNLRLPSRILPRKHRHEHKLESRTSKTQHTLVMSSRTTKVVGCRLDLWKKPVIFVMHQSTRASIPRWAN